MAITTTAAPPDDFRAFVADHEADLRRACYGLTGDDRLVDGLELDMLESVARHWPRLRKDSSNAKAVRYVNDMLRREARHWPRDDTAIGSGGEGPRVAPEDDEPPPRYSAATLADTAWAGRRARPKGRLTILAAVLVVTCGALLIPRPGVPPLPPPTIPFLPPPLPGIVQVLPPIQQLGQVVRLTALPVSLDPVAAKASPLTGGRTDLIAALQHDDDSPVLYNASGERWRLDGSDLTGAQIWATSMSPDGRSLVVSTPTGIKWIDLTSLSVHPLGSAQPTGGPIWLDARRFLLDGFVPAATTEISLDGGTRVLTGFDAARLVAAQGVAVGRADLYELTGQPGGGPARLRHLLPSSLGPDVNDKGSLPIRGAPWLGKWHGTAYSDGTEILAGADPRALGLAPTIGVAADAVFLIKQDNAQVTKVLLEAEGGAALRVLGFLPGGAALVQLSWDRGARLLRWDLQRGGLQTISGVLATATVSVVDLSHRTG